MHPKHLLARRLIAQTLAPASARPTTPTTITDAAHYMIATQGQNYAGGLTALAIRAGHPEKPLIIQTCRTGQHDTFVAAEVAIPRQVADAAVRTPAEKTRELTARYFSTRGPASIEDFYWWSTLPKTIATRTADALVAAGELTGFTLDGTTYYMGSWQKDVSPQELEHALSLTYHLPAFDEYFIAYKNRTHLFAPGVDPHTVMTKNGIGWPFAVEGGLMTGRA
ncbi:DNA glycosylase AlkZ-like family protein [Rothia nasimurium]|uniref:DNA glycosylase AlkZ-like family protein n=1 Tax=Rothia nasimurium TaxID=85336 RepID=UPI001F378E5A|nr:crosslink repair DNA glycosylase YcaQ family protein [Rothia nasimurium]